MKPFSIVQALVIGALVLLVMLAFLNKSKTGIQDTTDTQICKQSVETNAALRIKEFSINTEIKCPQLFIKLDKSLTKEKNAVFQTLALAMSDTWYEFLEGREEVFETDTQDYCVIRRVIEFDGEHKYKGFFDYLLMHNPPGMKKSYFTYLSDVSVEQGTTSLQKAINVQEKDVINTKVPYAAVYYLAKKAKVSKEAGLAYGAASGLVVGVSAVLILSGVGAPIGITVFTISAGAATGIAAGSVAGYSLGSDYAADWNAGIRLVPYTQESLNSLKCTLLPVSIRKPIS